MRRSGYASGNGVFTVLGDRLGSTSMLVDATGAVVAQPYYYPYGANRGSAQSDLTERRFTGQYQETGLAGAEGLNDYNARWWRWPAANAKRIRGAAATDSPMTPAIGRFVQADTIVPSPRSPQSLNRYAYVYNNPLKYVDLSGFDPELPQPRLAPLAQAVPTGTSAAAVSGQQRAPVSIARSSILAGLCVSQDWHLDDIPNHCGPANAAMAVDYAQVQSGGAASTGLGKALDALPWYGRVPLGPGGWRRHLPEWRRDRHQSDDGCSRSWLDSDCEDAWHVGIADAGTRPG